MNRKKLCALVGACVLAAMATGCQKGASLLQNNQHDAGFSKEQMMMIVANERNRYEQIYTNQIWYVAAGEDGATFQSHLLSQVKTFLEELETMNLLAEQKGVTLTSAESIKAAQMAEAYYGGLTSEDKAYLKVNEKDVQGMYEKYYLANKLVQELTKDINLEISDSEAKVIEIQQMEFTDEAAAQEAYGRVMAEGADFAAIAKEYSGLSNVNAKIGRGETDSAYEDAAFALENGQISPVVSAQGKYYIVKCINDYDEQATLERKEQLSTERKDNVFRQIYDQFQETNQISLDSDLWNSLTFSENDGTTTSDFFKIYQQYVNES